jgi:cell division protein FtsB
MADDRSSRKFLVHENDRLRDALKTRDEEKAALVEEISALKTEIKQLKRSDFGKKSKGE